MRQLFAPFSAYCYQFLPRDASAERGDATVSRPSVRDVQVSATHRLELFENNFTAE